MLDGVDVEPTAGGVRRGKMSAKWASPLGHVHNSYAGDLSFIFLLRIDRIRYPISLQASCTTILISTLISGL
ncbi:hypothetical protein GALL_367880 [mine drainage metagenome]|uniref:Uncharacterized protein n=1 Tax=mine drainage metagenome TaxID=410659 RepID=A0A1J5QCV4_9ZZZZ